jgi:hypothetical protein
MLGLLTWVTIVGKYISLETMNHLVLSVTEAADPPNDEKSETLLSGYKIL